jgi:hypothetical protein
MADLIPWSNLLPGYQSPGVMAEQNANVANTNASTGLIGAQTGLVGAQTTGANIQNQGALTQYQLLQQALNGGTPNGSAVPVPGTSGMLPGSNATPPGGNNGGGSSGSSGHPDNYPSVDDMAAYTASKVAPIPVQFSPQEQAWMQQMRSTGNPILAARADAFQQSRTQATNQENAQRQYQAQQGYAVASSVATAPDGAAFSVLSRRAPDLAQGLAAAHPDDFTTDSLGNVVAKPQGDADAKAYANSGAANIYRYTGYPHSFVNGQLIDDNSGKPVPGVDQILTHLTSDQRQKVYDGATAPVTVKNSDGTESQMPAWKASGALGGPVYHSPYDMVIAADRAASTPTNTGDSSSSPPGAPAPAARGASAPSGVTPTMLRPASQAQQPAPAAGNAPPSAAPQGSPAAPKPPATNASPSGNGSTPGQPGLLPGVNIDSLPKSPPPVSGRTPTVTEQATNDARKEGLKEALQQQAETIQNNPLLSQFQQKLNQVNPRDVGPGSEAYKEFLNLKSAVTGKPSQDLVDMGVLDKFANQLGVQNVRSLLAGQRITNQEMMQFMTRASASTSQPLDVMKTILAYQKANNDYDRMASATKLAALQKGADPFHLPGAIDAAAPRDVYVQQSMDKALGATPASRPGQGAGGAMQTATGPNGQKLYLRNGQWVGQ